MLTRQSHLVTAFMAPLSCTQSEDLALPQQCFCAAHTSSPMLLAFETSLSQQHGLLWQVAKVYLSIFSNDDAAKVLAVNSLKKLQGYVRTQIAHNMNLRLAPEIRFLEDEAALRGAEVRMALGALCILAEGPSVQSGREQISVTGIQSAVHTGCTMQPGSSSKLHVRHPF